MIKKIITVFFSVFLLCSTLTTAPIKSAPACWPFLSSDPDFPLEKDDDVYLVNDIDDLLFMKCLVNVSASDGDDGPLYADASYRLTADIDMTDINDWEPIQNFTGLFDGDNYTISDLTIENRSTYTNLYELGLFGKVENATIKNIVISSFNYNLEVELPKYQGYDWYDIGILASSAYETIFDNIKVENSAISLVDVSNRSNNSNYYVGGLIGFSEHVIIKDTILDVNLEISNNNDPTSFFYVSMGGIVGESLSTSIENSRFLGDIHFSSDIILRLNVGGLSGSIGNSLNESPMDEVDKHIFNNTVKSNITVDAKNGNDGNYYIGGLFGYFDTTEALITYNQVIETMIDVQIKTESSKQLSHLGGLIGQAFNLNMFRNKFNGSITTSTESNILKVGGLIGTLNQNSTIEQSFSIGSIESSLEDVAMIGGIVGELLPLYEEIVISDNNEVMDYRIKDVYSKVNIDVQNNALTSGKPLNIGGLVGLSSLNPDEITTLETSYFAATINTAFALANKINPLINNFYIDPFVYNSLYYDSTLVLERESEYGDGKSTVEMKNAATFENFDFDHVWARLDEYNNGYPKLRWGRYVTTFMPNNSNEPFYSFGYQSIKPKDNPIKQNFEFIGWRTDESSSNYEFNQVLNQDLLLTAYYLSNPTTTIQSPTLYNLKASNMLDNFTFTDQEREEAVQVKLVLSLLDKLSEKELGLVNQFIGSLEVSFTNPTYLDISLFKVIGQLEQKITSVNESIGISFILPEAYREETFIFLHIHEGVVKNVPYEYDNNTFEVTFSTKDFSSFVLLSQQQQIDEIDEEDPVINNPEDDKEEQEQPIISDPEDDEQEKALLPDTSDDSHVNMMYLLLLGMLLVLASYKKQTQ